MSDLNLEHSSIIFEFKHSQAKIEFLDVRFYKGHNTLKTTIYRKQMDRQNNLDA